MIKKVILYLLIIACLFPAILQAGETVTAKGFSFFEPGREVIGRDKALDEAKRAAIEKAMGTTIESKTVVENFAVVKDQIFSRASGYLKNIQILEENKSELGTYEVTIEAEVEISVLVNDLDRFQNMIKWQKNPRISIILEEGIQPDTLAAGKKTANLLTEKLKKNGFKVFRNTGNSELQMGLLVAVSLELSTRQTSYQGMELTLNEVSLSTNIYRPGDGEILASSSAVKSMPGEHRLQVLDKGSRSCVNAIWKELREKLLRLWEKELYSERDIYLILKPLPSIARAHEITAIFKSDVSGILEAEVLSFQNGTGEYSLKYRGWPEQLLNEIQLSYFKEKYFDPELESISGNKIVLKIK